MGFESRISTLAPHVSPSNTTHKRDISKKRNPKEILETDMQTRPVKNNI